LRVTLLGVEPPVWREVLVTFDLTFAQLHQVLQTAMGWEDCHLHEFEIGEVHVGLPAPKDFFAGDQPLLDERKTRLGDVLDGRRKFRYWYDFGDDWWHEIAIGKGAAATAVVRACLPAKARVRLKIAAGHADTPSYGRHWPTRSIRRITSCANGPASLIRSDSI
jgi:hypothetical protein